MNKQIIQWLATFVVALPVMFASLAAPEPACAGEDGVPLPSLPKAVTGEQCVEPVDVMRRQHMNFLIHQRDETLRQGIRGNKYSLRQCIECHATVDPKIDGGKVRSARPFCESCHKYAAITMDCFTCHNPILPLQQTGSQSVDPESDAAALKWKIAAHLGGGVFADPLPDKEISQ